MKIDSVNQAFEQLLLSEYPKLFHRGDTGGETYTLDPVPIFLAGVPHFKIIAVSGGFRHTFIIDEFGNIDMPEVRQLTEMTAQEG